MNNDTKKIQFFLPNLFTAMNMACGFLAILVAFKGEFYKACFFVGIGCIFDLFDGRVARWTGTQSGFGEQFDSLSDLVTFGMAPAIIFYLKFLSGYERLGIVLSFLYLLAGALRLARFNANINKVSSDFFQGLPSPGGALAMIGFILFSLEFNIPYLNIVSIAYIILYSILLVSTIPFYSFKKSEFIARHKRKVFLLIIGVIASIFIYEEIVLFVVLNLYVFISLMVFLKNKKNIIDESFALDD